MIMKILSFLLMGALIINSCSIIAYPSASSEVVSKVTSGAQSTDELYLTMIESSDKNYATYADTYISLEAQINSILLFDAVRPNSTDLIKIATLLKDHFETYKEDHKAKGKLSSGELRAYRNDLQAFWQSLLQAEKHLK